MFRWWPASRFGSLVTNFRNQFPQLVKELDEVAAASPHLGVFAEVNEPVALVKIGVVFVVGDASHIACVLDYEFCAGIINPRIGVDVGHGAIRQTFYVLDAFII